MARLTPSDVEPEQIRQVTADVLARSEFDAARPGLVERWGRALIDVIADVLAALPQGARGVAGVVVLGVAVVAVALIAWWLLRRVRPDRRGPARLGRIGGRGASDWQRDAERHAAAGEWTAALRCRYRALLADLVTAGLVQETAGHTARGYLHDLRDAAPQTEVAMTAVTEAFEAAWYASRPVTRADVEALQSAADAVRRDVLVPT